MLIAQISDTHISEDDGFMERTYETAACLRRAVEHLAKGSFTCWQMAGAGAVGGQVMMGLPVLNRLRHAFAGKIAVWPFQPLDKPVAFVEIWPSLNLGAAPPDRIKDAWQVFEVARVLSGLSHSVLTRMLAVDAPEEGWILGVGNGNEEVLRAHAA